MENIIRCHNDFEHNIFYKLKINNMVIFLVTSLNNHIMQCELYSERSVMKPMKKGIRLNIIISLVVIVGAIIAAIINFYTSSKALKNSLTESYLESNYNYTNKLAEGVELIINNLQKDITAIANLHSENEFNQKSLNIFLDAEKSDFNSIFITDMNGEIQLISPNELNFSNRSTIKKGTIIDKNVVNKSITEKKPFITEPYITNNGNALILVTAPIFDDNHTPKGVMVGTVHLFEENAINHLLKTHEYRDDTIIYVVDAKGHIVFHPDSKKLSTDASDDSIVATILRDKTSGYKEFTDSNNEKYFAGYSYIEPFKWGIISMTPASAINEPMKELFFDLLTRSSVVVLILVVIAALLMRTLTKPLTQLAEYSEKAILNNKINKVKEPMHINSQIYEVKQLSRQLQSHIQMLNREIQIDGLTGIANRRTFDATIKEWIETKQKFSLLLMDIDDFKRVNDTYGHLVGDDVLKFLSKIIESFEGEEDLTFRYGGEEFGLLLKNCNEQNAYEIAEKLRKEVADKISPTGEYITISIGVTEFKKDIHPVTIIERADKALYQSKRAGKNKSTIYSQS